MKELCGIYCILNLINGKQYIGLSRDIHRRWGEHLTDFRNHTHDNLYLQSSWYKYGAENFTFTVIELCDEKLLSEREKYYIKYYHTQVREGGYNLTPGGENVTTARPVIRLKDLYIFDSAKEASKDAGITQSTMSRWLKEKRKYMFLDIYESLSEDEQLTYRSFDWEAYDHERLSKAHSAENLSLETISKLRIATSGSNNPRAFKVYCPQLNETFDCAKDATIKYGINRGSIGQCIKGKLQSAGMHPVTKEKLTWIKV